MSSLTAVRGVAGQAAYGARESGAHRHDEIARARAGEAQHPSQRGRAGARDDRDDRGHAPERLKELRAIEALPTGTTPEDVAAMIVFLLSDRAAAITGQAFLVDAGSTA